MPQKHPRKTQQSSSTTIPTESRAHILRCTALLHDGNECSRTRNKPVYQYCQPHHREYKNLYCKYKKSEKEYDELVSDETDVSVTVMAEKIARGDEVITLRDEVNRRFFSTAGDNRNHVRWILKLKQEVDELKSKVKNGVDEMHKTAQNHQSSSTTEPDEGETNRGEHVYRSLLSPDIPMSGLDHLPDDSPVKVLKSALSVFNSEMRQRLYNIAPSLNDSSPMIKDKATGKSWPVDVGDKIVRFVLREFILWRADTETLALASRFDSIDRFLQHESTDELEYIRFFENLGREDTLHFIRDAICDYVHPPDASSAIIILGERVSMNDDTRRMSVEAWDILYQYFSDYVEWSTVEFFCFRFEDVLLIKRLIAMKRYHPEWYGGPCEEQPFSAFLGFISVTQGYQDPLIPLVEKDGIFTATECRCYLVGRMSKNDATTARLVQDLLRRIYHYIVLVYDPDGDSFILPTPTHQTDVPDENLWIKRTRSAETHACLDQASWDVEWSLKTIRNDVAYLQSLRERNMVKDYVEIVIIDRQPGHKFSLHSLVDDALMMLAGDPTEQEIVTNAIRTSMPEDEQAQWIEACSWEGSSIEDRHVDDVHYEGTRLRAWDVQQKQSIRIRDSLRAKPSLRDRRLICKILDQMEASGLISQVKEPVKAWSRPTLLYGMDGQEDLYFHYDFGPIDEEAISKGPLGIVPAPDSLNRFARAFQAVHPDAVFAKGRIDTHYCAWPMPVIFPGAPDMPTFCTTEGYLYCWNVQPFDFPLSQRSWQYYVNNYMNGDCRFARCVETTLVVAAPNSGEAAKNLALLTDVAKQQGWRLSIPHTSMWTGDIDSLALSTLWSGIFPVMQG